MEYKIIETLMRRDGISRGAAEEILEYMRSRVDDGEDPEEVLYDERLEPDYIFELLRWV